MVTHGLKAVEITIKACYLVYKFCLHSVVGLRQLKKNKNKKKMSGKYFWKKVLIKDIQSFKRNHHRALHSPFCKTSATQISVHTATTRQNTQLGVTRGIKARSFRQKHFMTQEFLTSSSLAYKQSIISTR